MTIENDIANMLKISPKVWQVVQEGEAVSAYIYGDREDIAAYNQAKVLSAMQQHGLSDAHFGWNTGYGYDDMGREVTEKIFAAVFGTEAALVRTQIVSGTHALSLVLQGILRPGDEVIYVTGKPYDTLEESIGIRGKGKGSLADFGITYRQVELKEDGTIDKEAVLLAVKPNTKMICLQRATGYAWRKSMTLGDIEEFCTYFKSRYPDRIIMADNCYGEFLDTMEPTQVGVDIMAGSLIKNPGGGLVLAGGYVAGRKDLVDLVSYRLTTPGIGDECGLTFGQTRSILQGLFMAPQVVAGALKGAILCGEVFSRLGFPVCPGPMDVRSDIIQAISFGSEEAMISFCKGVQAASPVNGFVTPVPAPMPGYEDDVIMAAGAFVQGSSIELSADGPLRPPYNVYFQGGLTYDHAKIGILKGLDQLFKDDLVSL